MNCKNGRSLMEKLSPSEEKLHASNALMKPNENVSIIFFYRTIQLFQGLQLINSLMKHELRSLSTTILIRMSVSGFWGSHCSQNLSY